MLQIFLFAFLMIFVNYRSCHVGKDKYSIGDFVFIKEIHQTSDNGFVGRIESFHDKGL